MRVGIVYKYDSLNVAREVADFLREAGVKAELHHIPTCSLEDCGIIVTVGGDGTILRTLQELKNPPPIFGINTGRMGILTHAEPGDYRESLLKAVNGELEVEEFMRIEARYRDVELTALNEVAILSSAQARLIEYEVVVNGRVIDSMRADGAIFSTPVGSTAYSLSAGGPIIDPYTSAICFTPVSPFRVGWRPWVFSGDREVVLRLKPLRDAVAIADGNRAVEVEAGGEVVIRKSKHPARFFRVESRLKKIAEKMRKLR
ncbi:MAG: NAD(+)/NADH kinase [Archaeoglobi archaeon]|nr:NAD(+)/NADH kinase [Archaeoglobi archaeon]